MHVNLNTKFTFYIKDWHDSRILLVNETIIFYICGSRIIQI